MTEQSLLTGFFLCKAQHSFLVLRNTNSPSALCLGAILNQEITNKKHKKYEKYGIKQTKRRTLAYSPCWTSAGDTSGGRLTSFTNLLRSANDLRAPQVLILGLQINFSQQVSQQIRNSQIIRIDYTFSFIPLRLLNYPGNVQNRQQY